MNKKFIYILLTSLFLLILPAGCADKEPKLVDSYVFGQDDQYYFNLNRHAITPARIAESEKGFYFFSGPNNQYLFYMDKATKKSSIVCNKPDCQHVNETNSARITDCNAYFLEANKNLLYYDNSLYLMSFNGEIQSLYKVSADGTKREKLFTFKEYVTRLIIHRGYVYYIVEDNGTVAGNEQNTATVCKLYRVKLNNLSGQPELLHTVQGIYGTIDQLFGYGNNIYFHFYSIDYSTKLPTNNTLFRYNIIQQNVEEACRDTGAIVIHGNSIICDDLDLNVYIYDMKSMKKAAFGKVKGVPYGTDDQYVYICDWDDKEKLTFRICKWSGEQVFELSDFGVATDVYGGNEDYFFIADNGNNENQYGSIKALYLIDKKKLADNSATLEKVYEFIPTVSSPGVFILE